MGNATYTCKQIKDIDENPYQIEFKKYMAFVRD
jgi:hypothetical protein